MVVDGWLTDSLMFVDSGWTNRGLVVEWRLYGGGLVVY